MIKIPEIDQALEKAANFLIRSQNKDGSWNLEELKHNQPPEYHKDIVVASENVLTLIMCKQQSALESIKRGLNFVAQYELSEMDPIVWWVYKLRALKYSAGDIYKKEISALVDFISKRQKNGCWEVYPITSTLTNYMCLHSLLGLAKPEVFNNSKKWFKKAFVPDKGWGRNDKDNEANESFTAISIIASVLAGESPVAQHMQSARIFLEKTQNNEGMWKSSKYTINKPTTYSTAIAILALMLSSDNPFNKRVEKGIAALLRTQSRGGWPHAKTGKALFYTTKFAIQTMAFYKYLDEKWHSQKAELLKSRLSPQEVAAYYFLSFDDYLKSGLKDMLYNGVLSSGLLGNTMQAVARRKDILIVLSDKKELDAAEIIDELKKKPGYNHLNKKHHITQIKSDMDYLCGLNLTSKIGSRYFVAFNLI